MRRFLKRVWRLVTGNSKFEIRNSKLSGEAAFMMHKTIKKVSEDIENLRYNTAISAIMEWVNALEERKVTIDNLQLTTDQKNKSNVRGQMSNVSLEEVQALLLLLAPFAPHMAEELWQFLGNSILRSKTRGSEQFEIMLKQGLKSRNSKFNSIHLHPWPKYDPKLATSEKVELVVQVNGKVRDRITVNRGIAKEDAQKLALELKNTQKYLSGKVPQKVIFVKGRLINFVV